MPDSSLRSTVSANAFGAGMPNVSTDGATSSTIGDSILPAFGYIWRRPGEKHALHIGFSGVAGFGVDYPQDNTLTAGPAAQANSNLILTPQMPNGFGFGHIESDYRLMKIYIGNSYQVSDNLSWGYSLVPAYSQLKVSPAPFAAPDDANGDGFSTYPNAAKMASAFGFGVQAGVAYDMNERLTLGLSVASPISMGDYTWSAADENGAPRSINFDMDVPMFITTGLGYKLNDKTQLAFDIKWINYEQTHGFEQNGFNPDGSVAGFGWDNIMVYAMGVQHELNGRWKVRVGYNHSDDPIPGDMSFFNTPAPAEVQDRAAIGFTYKYTDYSDIHFGYYKAFEHTHSGPMQGAAGAVANTQIYNTLAEDSLSLGYSYKF
jgi:long-chain fatty acid transport protein